MVSLVGGEVRGVRRVSRGAREEGLGERVGENRGVGEGHRV